MASCLGYFLRARRQATPLSKVGLPPVGRRRTPGLRRDEVAVLAGVSVDYYTRLEQGRETRPSEQVVNALAEALDLDGEATQHLHDLARPKKHRRAFPGHADQVNPKVLQLMAKWEEYPSTIVNNRLDVLARNALASALFQGMEHADNLLRLMFLNPASRDFFLDWEEDALSLVADLRAMWGTEPDVSSLVAFVEELSAASGEFGEMWARHDVRAKTHHSIEIRHRWIGEVTFWHETFSIDSAPGQRLFVGIPEAGSPSEHALAELYLRTTAER
ncbi:helix-turn-helix transcriptional regulator [Sphaerisporangium sp. NPDC005288]|uniref:helix-turn-helix transcriptional regulator n=1 Tax=Sphaerisporangium sp. NPDC005288 TaxID=3155114 RepID=UPI00339E8934